MQAAGSVMTDSWTSDPSDLGTGSSMPWPTSYPHYLTTVDYQDMFTETEGVLIWGGSDRLYHDQSLTSLSTILPGSGLWAAWQSPPKISS